MNHVSKALKKSVMMTFSKKNSYASNSKMDENSHLKLVNVMIFIK